jgi:hypothetical protein
MPGQYFRINKSFIAVVSHDDDRDIIKLGNPTLYQVPCVEFHIFKSSGTIYLASLIYSPKCNLNNNLAQGDDGTVTMLKCAISFAFKLYPSCHKFELTDNSGYIDRAHGRAVHLSDRDILLYRKTWYQRKLPEVKLKPSSPAYRRYHKVFLKTLDLVLKKKDIDAIRELNGRYEFFNKTLSEVIQ